jgi:hypothetical protein
MSAHYYPSTDAYLLIHETAAGGAPGKLKEKCAEFDCLKNLELLSAKAPLQASLKAEWYKYAESLEKEDLLVEDTNYRSGAAWNIPSSNELRKYMEGLSE